MAMPDPIASRFVPDQALVNRAHNRMLQAEGPLAKFVRQQWDVAFGATRVALDSLREIWPTDTRDLDQDTRVFLMEALQHLEDAYHCLDSVAEAMVGQLVVDVQMGRITSQQDFDNAVEHYGLKDEHGQD